MHLLTFFHTFSLSLSIVTILSCITLAGSFVTLLASYFVTFGALAHCAITVFIQLSFLYPSNQFSKILQHLFMLV